MTAGTTAAAPPDAADAVALGAASLDVLAALPHRYPMLLVDRVTELVPGQRACAVKAITYNEPWYAGLPDGAPADYPAALLIESFGQAAGILATATATAAAAPVEASEPSGTAATEAAAPADSNGDQVMLFGAVSDVRLHRPVQPGVLLVHRVVLSRAVGDSLIFEGDSVVDGEPVLTVARMVLALRSPRVLRHPLSGEASS